MIRLFNGLLTSALLILFAINGFSQPKNLFDKESSLAFANYLFRSANYEMAAIEFERLALIDSSNLTDHQFKVVLSYRLANKLDIGFKRFNLQLALRFRDPLVQIFRRNIVIGNGEGRIRATDFPSGCTQPFKGLRARHLVDEMPVDIDEARAVGRLMDQVFVPDLVVECFSSHGGFMQPVIAQSKSSDRLSLLQGLASDRP